MDHQPKTHYSVLGVAADASAEEIKRRYHELARRLHPDVSQAETGAVFLRINLAYQVLHDPEKRQAYDDALGGTAPQGTTRSGAAPPAPVDVAAVLSEAEAAYMQGRTQDAHVLCQKALRADGRCIAGLTLLADILVQKGQPERAVVALRLALHIAPDPRLQSKMNRLRQTSPSGAGASATPHPREAL